MKVASKHSQEWAGILTRFQGGLNKTLPPHAIEDEELIDATNMHYSQDTGYLRTRDGLKRYSNAALAAEINGVFEYVKDGVSKVLLTIADSPQKLYYLNATAPTLIGNLTGTKRPSFAVINGVCLIASGGQLQSYDGTTLTTITSPTAAPVLDFITDASKRDAARVLGCGNTTYSDRLFFSGINDGTYWTMNASPESDAKYMDAGYKDGQDLVGIGMYQGDAFLFKRAPYASAKSIYRAVVSDVAANWSCLRFRNFHSALSPHLIREIADGLLFVDNEGPKLLQFLQNGYDVPYDISPAAHKIAGEMARYAASDGFIIIDPIRMIAMVKPTKNHDTFYCMDFLKKRWTNFAYALNIQSGAYCLGKMLFGATDGYVYEYDSALSTDNGVAYTMTAETKWFNLFSMFQELVKDKELDLIGLSDGNGTITIKQKGALILSIPFSFTQGWWDWSVVNALDPEDWTEDLEKTPMSEIQDPEVIEGDFMSVAVSITTGQCQLSHLAARVAKTRKN